MPKEREYQPVDVRASHYEYKLVMQDPLLECLSPAGEHVWCGEYDFFDDRRRRYEQLTAGQQTLLPVSVLNEDVCFGGFQQYFWRQYSDFAIEAIAGLQKIGATGHAEILANSVEVFPDGIVPREREDRWQILVDHNEYHLKYVKVAMQRNSQKSYVWRVEPEWTHPPILDHLNACNSRWNELDNSPGNSLTADFGPRFIEYYLPEFVR